MARPAQQRPLRAAINRIGVGVVAAEAQRLQRLPFHEAFHALCARPPDIDVEERRRRARGDQVLDVIVEPSHAAGQRPPDLFDTHVIPNAGLGLQCRIAAKGAVKLLQRRRLEARTRGGLQLGTRAFDHPGRRDAPGGAAAETAVVVEPNGGAVVQPAAEVRLHFGITGIGGDAARQGRGKAERQAGMQRIARGLRPQHQGLAIHHHDIALPVRLDAVALLATVAVVRILGVGDVAAIGDAERLVEAAIPQLQVRGAARLVVHGMNAGAGGRREGCKGDEIERVAGELAQAVVIARNQAQIEVRRDVQANLRRGGDIVVEIIIAALAHRQQVQRRHRRRTGKLVLHRGAVMDTVVGPGNRRRLVEGIERTAFGAGMDRQRAVTHLGDDIDDAADGVGAVKRALRPAQHFHPREIPCQQLGDIGRATGGGGIGHVNAVHDQLHMVGIGAAHEQRGLAARPARLGDGKARHFTQHIGQRTVLTAFNVGGGDDRHAAGNLRHRGWQPVGNDHHAFIRQGAGQRRRDRDQGKARNGRIKKGLQHKRLLAQESSARDGVKSPRDQTTPTLSPLAVSPAAPRTPRQDTRRQCEAGLLASGSTLPPVFPVFPDQ